MGMDINGYVIVGILLKKTKKQHMKKYYDMHTGNPYERQETVEYWSAVGVVDRELNFYRELSTDYSFFNNQYEDLAIIGYEISGTHSRSSIHADEIVITEISFYEEKMKAHFPESKIGVFNFLYIGC